MSSIYVNVRIDEDEVVSDLSDRTILEEFKSRKLKASDAPDIEPPKAAECWQTLSDAAYKLRQSGQVSLAWRLDEIRHDYFASGSPSRPRMVSQLKGKSA